MVTITTITNQSYLSILASCLEKLNAIQTISNTANDPLVMELR